MTRGSGNSGDVFGLGTPLDHLTHTPIITAPYYILYIYKVNNGGLGGVVEWGHETKNNT